MSSQKPSAQEIQAEFELIRYRQVALRIAMQLFDALNDAPLLTQIGRLLDESSRASNIEQINSIIQQLKQIAALHNVLLPVDLM